LTPEASFALTFQLFDVPLPSPASLTGCHEADCAHEKGRLVAAPYQSIDSPSSAVAEGHQGEGVGG
jgi:hypothetical protein